MMEKRSWEGHRGGPAEDNLSHAEKLGHHGVLSGKPRNVTRETGSDTPPRKAGRGPEGRQGTEAAGQASHREGLLLKRVGPRKPGWPGQMLVRVVREPGL